MFTPAKTRSDEAAIRWWLMKLNAPKFEGPVFMSIDAYFKKPKSAPKNRIHPTVKPDWDNIGKLVCDAANGILYDDDKQIVSGHLRKIYDDTERIEISIGAY